MTAVLPALPDSGHTTSCHGHHDVPLDCIHSICRHLSPFRREDVRAFAALTECFVESRSSWQHTLLSWVLSASNVRRITTGFGRRRGDAAPLAARVYAKALDVISSIEKTPSLKKRLLVAHLFLAVLNLDDTGRWTSHERTLWGARRARAELDQVLAVTGLEAARCALRRCWQQEQEQERDGVSSAAYDTLHTCHVAFFLLEMATAEAIREGELTNDYARAWRTARRRGATRADMRAWCAYTAIDMFTIYDGWRDVEAQQRGRRLLVSMFLSDAVRCEDTYVADIALEVEVCRLGNDPEDMARFVRSMKTLPSPSMARRFLIRAVQSRCADAVCALLPHAMSLSPSPAASTTRTTRAADELHLSDHELYVCNRALDVYASPECESGMTEKIVTRAIEESEDDAARANRDGLGDAFPSVSLTLLCVACLNGDEPLAVRLICEHGASPHAGLGAPLCWAAVRGMSRTVELLLDRGADVGACHGLPLPLAAQAEKWDIVTTLFAHMCQRPRKREARTQALRWAAARGRTDMMRALVHEAAGGVNISEGQHDAYNKVSKAYIRTFTTSTRTDSGDAVVPVNCAPDSDSRDIRRTWLAASYLLLDQYGVRDRFGAMLRTACGITLMCTGCLTCAAVCCCTQDRIDGMGVRAMTANKYGLQRVCAEYIIMQPLSPPHMHGPPIATFDKLAFVNLSCVDLWASTACSGCVAVLFGPCFCVDILHAPISTEASLARLCGWPWLLFGNVLRADW